MGWDWWVDFRFLFLLLLLLLPQAAADALAMDGATRSKHTQTDAVTISTQGSKRSKRRSDAATAGESFRSSTRRGGGRGRSRGKSKATSAKAAAMTEQLLADWTDDEDGGDSTSRSGATDSRSNAGSLEEADPSGLATRKRARRTKPEIPQFWQSLLASMPSNSAKARPWALPRFRQMILDCYIEKVRRGFVVCFVLLSRMDGPQVVNPRRLAT